jgi:hypothetical protein
LGLVTIFHCLRFETSLFVASYYSQGHGGGIRTSGNAFVRRLARSIAWSWASVFPRVAFPFSQFALLHSVTCVRLRLITILGNCGCVAVASFLGVGRPLRQNKMFTGECCRGPDGHCLDLFCKYVYFFKMKICLN